MLWAAQELDGAQTGNQEAKGAAVVAGGPWLRAVLSNLQVVEADLWLAAGPALLAAS